MKAAIVLAMCAATRVAAADEAACTKAADLAAKGDLVRAALAACDDEAFARQLQKKLLAANLGSVEIVSSPEGLVCEVDTLPGEPIRLPATVWLPPGTHTAKVEVGGVVLTNVLEVKAHSRGTSIFNAPPKAVEPTGPARVDFADEGGGSVEQQTAPPPDVKHPPLTPDKYRGVTTAAGPPIADPLANGMPDAARGPRGWSIGGRAGGGMVASGGAHASASVAAVGRFAIDGATLADTRFFVDARVDWARRGAARVDSLGVAPAVGGVLDRFAFGTVAATLGASLDTRLQTAMGVARVGASATAGFELALADAPIVAGLRYALGLTKIGDAKDSAFFVEVGVELR